LIYEYNIISVWKNGVAGDHKVHDLHKGQIATRHDG
jgi:hypothetical protein